MTNLDELEKLAKDCLDLNHCWDYSPWGEISTNREARLLTAMKPQTVLDLIKIAREFKTIMKEIEELNSFISKPLFTVNDND